MQLAVRKTYADRPVVHAEVSCYGTPYLPIFKHLTMACSHAVIWFIYLLCYGEFPLTLSQAIYHMFVEVLAPAPVFWLIVLVTPFACVLPGFFIRRVYR